jgi:hypothetical protein
MAVSVGSRHGVEPNSEMLGMACSLAKFQFLQLNRRPLSAIIIASSLDGGVQVQPGDIVIYADTNF